eukprot:TRINITY_DN19353_c1_g1_i1.p1 TRINITY_DN19353_c1_g1~~TRINITY_DN19353_c1_g1_i1.p1  ORF type:complete len:158 (-),score=26.23 TRINITY_DN19353_c1_g1_i1:277-750(-)
MASGSMPCDFLTSTAEQGGFQHHLLCCRGSVAAQRNSLRRWDLRCWEEQQTTVVIVQRVWQCDPTNLKSLMQGVSWTNASMLLTAMAQHAVEPGTSRFHMATNACERCGGLQKTLPCVRGIMQNKALHFVFKTSIAEQVGVQQRDLQCRNQHLRNGR